MKIGPFEIGRIRAAAQPPAPQKEIGASGTLNLSGFLTQDDYNPDLRGKQALATFDRMRRSDASVREALQHIIAPIRNAIWTIEPASDEPLDLEIAEFVRSAYFEWPEQNFSEYLSQSLLYLAFGHQVFEQVDKVVEEELNYDDAGQTVTVPRRQFLALDHFGQRLPHTIWKWHAERGKLQAIEQQVWIDGGFEIVEIPAERLVVFVHEREGDDFTGNPILRSAYKPWVMKELIEKVSAIAVEVHGVGVKTAYIPERLQADEQVMARVGQMLQDLRSGESNYMLFSGRKQSASQDGYLFEIVTPPGGIPDFAPLLNYHRAEIKAAVLARFAELGHAQTGARATGDTQSQVWYAALHAVARHIGEINDVPIKRLVDANYSTERYPKLTASDIESRNLQEFADAHAKLVASGAIVADAPYRAFVRESLDAPEEDEATTKQQDELAANPPPPSGDQYPPPKPTDQQPKPDQQPPPKEPA